MSSYRLRVNGTEYRAEVKEISADRALVEVNDETYSVDLLEFGRRSSATVRKATAAPHTPAKSPSPAAASRPSAPTATSAGTVVAPLPGLVLQLKVAPGDEVSAGQLILVMEAMKMENQITAPRNGSIRKVFVSEGDNVGEGDALVEISRPEMTTL